MERLIVISTVGDLIDYGYVMWADRRQRSKARPLGLEALAVKLGRHFEWPPHPFPLSGLLNTGCDVHDPVNAAMTAMSRNVEPRELYRPNRNNSILWKPSLFEHVGSQSLWIRLGNVRSRPRPPLGRTLPTAACWNEWEMPPFPSVNALAALASAAQSSMLARMSLA